MKTLITLVLFAFALTPVTLQAQVEFPASQYEALKKAGKLPPNARPIMTSIDHAAVNGWVAQHGGWLKGGGSEGAGNGCGLWQDPSGCPISQGPNDDGSSSMLTLPFSFDLYGTNYTNFYINNNGNISFNSAYGTYSPVGFPDAGYVMVAPFWADVETVDQNGGTIGTVTYCMGDHRLVVNWNEVGYYWGHSDKLNTFQLILTDGTDPLIGVGNNVAFSYLDMQWTTGDASGGTNGFGGSPATVGANLGNGVGYILIGRFDHAGVDYAGPTGLSGVSWLDNKDFVFSTLVPSSNIAPIVTGTFICDTIEVCSNSLADVEVNFLGPEPDQIVTPTFSAPDFPQFNPVLTSGSTASIIGPLIPTDAQVGFHTITFTGTDNGTPVLSQTTTVVVHVLQSPSAPPVITGDTLACPGLGTVLNATGGFDTYHWSNGYNGETVLVGPGVYYVSAESGGCNLVSDPVTITAAIAPTPVISGVLFNCGGDPAHLMTSEPYSGYHWSNGSTDPSIDVYTGSYSVIVTDAHGCTGHADTVNVVSVNSPTAMFMGNPNGPVTPGTTVIYTDQSDGNGSTIVSWAWTIDSAAAGAASSYAPTFIIPGTYAITLTVATANGCTATYTYSQVVVPTDIIAPNVFSPNNDGVNDALVFEGAQYYPNTALSVFNRWGQEVYSSGNYKNTWKGTDMPNGTYFYVLKLETGKEYSGNVTLLR
jgi:gliding motility-associated-like protein